MCLDLPDVLSEFTEIADEGSWMDAKEKLMNNNYRHMKWFYSMRMDDKILYESIRTVQLKLTNPAPKKNESKWLPILPQRAVYPRNVTRLQDK